eukprot:3876339-Ditylum_brightwellii.AAC.1
MESKQKEESNDLPHGSLTNMHADDCILSGMIFEYGGRSSHALILLIPDCNDTYNVPACGKQKVNCLQRMEKLAPPGKAHHFHQAGD